DRAPPIELTPEMDEYCGRLRQQIMRRKTDKLS
ncbi:unnamed protein product, partial [Allacma fusca]